MGNVSSKSDTSSELDTSTSPEPSSDTPSVASRPTERELDLELVEIVHWQRFATHLPNLTRADIEEIKVNNPQNVKQQKLDLFGTWLRKSSDATWNDVISALERAEEKKLSDTLRKVLINILLISLLYFTCYFILSVQKFRISKQNISPESKIINSDTPKVASKHELVVERSCSVDSNSSIPSNTAHPWILRLTSDGEKEIRVTLLDLHYGFLNLVTEVRKALEKEINTGDLTITILTGFIQTYMHWEDVELLVEQIEDLNQLFPKLHRYFDFLECGLIVAITEKFIGGELTSQIKEYEKDALQLRSIQTVKNLKTELRKIYTPHLQDISNMPQVLIELNDVWKEAAIEGLYLLVKYLLPRTKQQSLLEHITIDTGSVLIKYRVEESYVDYLIAYAENKPQFMRLIGIFGLVINNIPILQEDENKNFTFRSALLESSQSGNNEAVQFILDLGVNVNYSNSEGKTALMLACEAGHEKVVQTLVSADANINLQDSAGQTALMLADGYVGIVHRLLLAKANPNLQQKDGNTALHIACYKDQNTHAELLLSFGATFVIPNTKGDTAFLASVRGNNTEILKLMLNSIPHSPFIVSLGVVYACRFGHSAVFNLFAKQLEYSTQTAKFFISCAEGDVVPVVQHITKFKIDPNTKLISGITPLMIASSFGNADVLDCLLEAEADVNSTDQDGYSPLTYAITGNTSLHIVQRLLEAGSNPNILVGGVTIAERAREKGEQTICDLLLKYSALHLYKRFIHLVDRIQEGINTLINQRGIDIIFQITQKLEETFRVTGLASTVQTSIDLFNQLTPYYDFLHFEMLVTIVREFLKGDIENELEVYCVMASKFEEAVEIQKFKDVLSLLPQQEVMSSTSCFELTFQLKKQWGNLTLMSLRRLYSYLFSDDQKYLSHMTVNVIKEEPYITFLIPKSTKIIEDLTLEEVKKKKSMYLLGVIIIMIDNIQVLADENTSFTFDSALLESSQSGNNEAVQFILDLRVNVNYSNSEGKTALMLACQAGHEEVVQTLVSAEADVNLQDSAGETALMLADGNVGIVHHLLLANANPDLQQKDGNTALHIACYKGQSTLAQSLLRFGAAFVIPNTKGDTAFLASVRGNNTEILKLMLNSIPHSPFIVSLGVVYACRFGHSAVFNLFVKQLEYTTQIANFFISCAEGDVGSVVQHITEFNIDPNTTLISGITPLMIASSFGNADVFDCLLEAEADVNNTDQDGYSPLTYAVTCNTSLHIVQCLLEAGANSNILVGGVAIVERAREKGEQTICDLLLKYSALHLYQTFIHRVDKIQEGIDTLINQRGIFQITQKLEETFRLTGLTSKVQTSIDLFNQLTPYYDFLHLEMLVTIVKEFLKGDIENELEEYQEMATKFMELVEIQKFKDVLSLLPQQEVMSSTSCSELTFKLNRQWGNLTLKSLRRLCSYLLSDYQTYFSHMTVDIVEEVLRIKFLIPKLTQVVDLASEKTKKEKLLYLFGVIEIMLDDTLVLTGNENKNFTFDSAFLESSESGNNEAVQFLLDLGVNINYSNSEGKTALMLACQAGHEEVVKTLVLVGANVNFQDNIGQTALMVSKTKEIFSLLLQSNADINILTHRGSTPLIAACALGHLSVVEMLLVEYNNDPNFRNEIGRTALLYASWGGHYQVVEILLEKGADPNIQDEDGVTGLSLASETGHQQVVELLLERQVDPNVQNSKNGRTALIQASQQGHYQVVELLLKKGADPNLHDNRGCTALMSGSLGGHSEVVHLLIKAGADLNMAMTTTSMSLSDIEEIESNLSTGLIPESVSFQMKKSLEIMKPVLQQNPNSIISYKGMTALTLAVDLNQVNTAKILLEAGANPNVKVQFIGVLPLMMANISGDAKVQKLESSSLMMACARGDVEMVKLLLRFEADVNATNELGVTALMTAISIICINNLNIDIPKELQMMIKGISLENQNSYLTIIELLLEAQNPPIDSQKALMIASCLGDVEVVRVLLKKHIDANVQIDCGYTPLMMSCRKGHIQVVQQLLNHGADLMTTDKQDFNALDAVITGCKDIQIIDCLLDRVADEHKQSYISRGLHNACLWGCSDIISHLISKMEMFISDNLQLLALKLCADGDLETVELLITDLLDIQCSVAGITPLMVASSCGHEDIARTLTESGADVNKLDESGYSPLIYATIGRQSIPVMQMLLDAKANPNVVFQGKTVLDVASKRELTSICELLLKYNALSATEIPEIPEIQKEEVNLKTEKPDLTADQSRKYEDYYQKSLATIRTTIPLLTSLTCFTFN